MKGTIHRTWKKIMPGMLILIMGSLLLNQALYTHIHVLPDGSIVSHAHPFHKTQQSDQGSTHQHSSLEFFLLESLQLLFLATTICMVLMHLGQEVLRVSIANRKYIPAQLVPLPGRAPPGI